MYGHTSWAGSLGQRRTSPSLRADQPLVGTSASGFDLTAMFQLHLQTDQVRSVRSFWLQSVAVSGPALRPQNRRALDLLEAWMAEPDDLDEAWWEDFERELQQHRFTLREA